MFEDSQYVYITLFFNIEHFIFATPFTKNGKAHGDLHEQCKRKTILTTANHFPYVKTRIQVISRKQVRINIHFAKTFAKYTNSYRLSWNPSKWLLKTFKKKLSNCLLLRTRSLLTQKYCKWYYKDVSEPPSIRVQWKWHWYFYPVFRTAPQYRLNFKTNFDSASRIFQKSMLTLSKHHWKDGERTFLIFINCRCHDALKKNKNLILADQKDYQKELERNYLRFTERLAPLIAISPMQAMGVIRYV